MIGEYLNFLIEHKFWGKTISEMLNWIKIKSDKYWVLLDTETTGLPNNGYNVQLTQISCLIVKYNFDQNKFEEIDSFDKKIKLTPETLSLMNDVSRIKKVLSFNHYGKSKTRYQEEDSTLSEFYEFINKYRNPVLVIQNAEFDMMYLNIRSNIKFDNEVLDTKQILQLFYLPALLKLSETNKVYRDLVDKIGVSDRDNGLISSSMSKIGPALDINMSGYHDALKDCRLMMEMFQKIISFLNENKNLDIRKYQSDRINTKKK